MITIDEKEYRNLQEQVGYLTEELKKLKQSLGNALPDPIPGPTGETGLTGSTGPQGRTPKIGFGFGPLPTDSSFENGDLYIIRGTANGLTKGNTYKKVNGSWQLQLNIVGPQGPVGPVNDNEVTANPSQPYSEFLTKVEIDGIVYGIPTGNFVKTIDAPTGETLTEEEKTLILNGVFVNGELLGYKNPVLFPATKSGNYYYGMFAGPYNGTSYTIVGQYQINPDNSIVERGVYGNIELRCIAVINGKEIPTFPNSPSTAQVLTYQPSNQLAWVNERKKLYQHNIKITFNDDSYIVFTIVCNYDEPIVDISELLEYKYQLEQLPALYYSGQVYDGVVINLPQNGVFSFDVGGGNQTYDYNDDITDITDHFVPLN